MRAKRGKLAASEMKPLFQSMERTRLPAARAGAFMSRASRHRLMRQRNVQSFDAPNDVLRRNVRLLSNVSDGDGIVYSGCVSIVDDAKTGVANCTKTGVANGAKTGIVNGAKTGIANGDSINSGTKCQYL